MMRWWNLDTRTYYGRDVDTGQRYRMVKCERSEARRALSMERIKQAVHRAHNRMEGSGK